MTQKILKKYSVKAKKSLGQNFLINDDIVSDISEIIDVFGKNIIEVGPGYGVLTQKLLQKKPKSLTLVELDSDMIDILKDRVLSGDLDLSGVDFEIKKQDILKFKPSFKNYSVIANIPYYITSPILRHFLYNVDISPENMVILMQKDVGDKIVQTASFLDKNIQKDSKKKSSVLGLFVAKKYFVQNIFNVEAVNFKPQPKVKSSALLFKKHNLYKNIDDDFFLKLIKQGFSQVRKKLLKNFVNAGYKKDFILDLFQRLSINKNSRAEDLSIDDWIALISEFYSKAKSNK